MDIFVGREAELNKIRELLGKDRGALLFTGESGMGKTVLLQKAAAEWRAQPEVLVAVRECWHNDTGASPFVALLADLLRSLGDRKLRPTGEYLKKLGESLLSAEMGQALLTGLLETLGAKLAGPFTILFEQVKKQWDRPGVQPALGLLSSQPMNFMEQYLRCLEALTRAFPGHRWLLMLDQMERPDLPALKMLLDLAHRLPPRTFLLIGFKREAETQPKFATISAPLTLVAE